MKQILRHIACALLMVPIMAPAQTEEQKAIEVINRSSARIMGGELKALDDVKALPGDYGVMGLLMFFGNFHGAYRIPPEHQGIAPLAARYVTECPAARSYALKLFRKHPAQPESPRLTRERNIMLDCLGAANNLFGLDLIFELFDDPALAVSPDFIGLALARAEIPGAPFSWKTRESATTEAGIAEWKQWWKANRPIYVAKAK